MTLFGAVEIGGTKTDITVGTSPADLVTPHRITTGSPDVTLEAVIDYFADHEVQAVGIASFGPLDLDPASERFGRIVSTPKQGWSDVDLLGRLETGLGVPLRLDTDVNGAARGEGRWGAATGMGDFVYVTMGTGIGAGVVVAGKLIGGSEHPETGHIVVRREDDDSYEGQCPFHDDCLEGLAAGPALEARFGRPETWAGNDEVLRLATGYLAQAVRNLVYTVAPQRVIVGGGVAKLPGFHERLRERTGALLGDYPQKPDLDLLVSPPGLGDLSGLAGALVLAQEAI